MVKIISLAFVITLVFNLIAGLFFILGSPGKKLSVYRSVFCLTLLAGVNLALWMVFIFLRFGTGLSSIKGFYDNLKNGSFLYQDIEYISLVAILGVAVTVFFGFHLRRLIYDSQPCISRLQENLVIISVLFSMAFLCVGFEYADRSKEQIKLSLLHGDGSLIEESGTFTTEDFVKLRNTGANTVDLDNMFLSDKLNDLDLLPLKGYVVSPGEEIAIYLDVTSPFQLGEGETVYLSDKGGRIYDSLLYDPEPEVMYDEPLFSAESGFYDDPFSLTLSYNEDTGKDLKIFYTIDGSEPTQGSILYEQPIEIYDKKGESAPCNMAKNVVFDYMNYEPESQDIDRAFVVRAAVFDDEGHRSKSSSKVYFIGYPDYKDKKIISITADYEDLFGENGICVTGVQYDMWYTGGQVGEAPEVNFRQSGKNWEREGNIQFLDHGSFKGEQDIGIRVFGGTSREFAKKHFSIYSRKSYGGSDSFSMDIFGSRRPVHSIALRDGISDALIQDLSSGRDVASQQHTRVSVFLNGEYWFDTFACEKYSPAYFYEHKGINEDNIIIVKEGVIDTGKPEDEALYQQIYDYIGGHDLGDPAYYAEFCTIIDVQSYIDYLCAVIYGCNLDQNEVINRQMYRARIPIDYGENDGRWRWSLYDMDYLDGMLDVPEYFGVQNAYEINSFKDRQSDEAVSVEEQTLFKALMQNGEFREQFVSSFEDVIENDYSMEKVDRALDKYADDSELKEFLRDYFVNRPGYMRQYLNEEFGAEAAKEEGAEEGTEETAEGSAETQDTETEDTEGTE